jgi:hypothetical protein
LSAAVMLKSVSLTSSWALVAWASEVPDAASNSRQKRMNGKLRLRAASRFAGT